MLTDFCWSLKRNTPRRLIKEDVNTKMQVNTLYITNKHADSFYLYEVITMDTFKLTLGAKYIYGIVEIGINCVIIRNGIYKTI